MDAIIKGVKEGVVSEEVINKSCRRVIAWKLKYLPNFSQDKGGQDKKEPEGDNSSTLIIVFSIIGGLIIIGLVIFLIVHFKRKNRLKNLEDGSLGILSNDRN